MKKDYFGMLAATALMGALASSHGLAKEQAKPEKKSTKKADNEYYCAASCAGKSECKGYGNNSCKGKNTCHYQGFITAKGKTDCEKKGGIWHKKDTSK